MGVVHKLKPEILNFILEIKQKDPNLSCRSVTQLSFEKFQVKISKSSINSIFKENNLSMPIGRRQKQKRKSFNMPVLPVIEEVKTIVVINPVIENPPQTEEIIINSDIVSLPEAVMEKADEIAGNENIPAGLEEKRIKEAQEWAAKMHEEEYLRMEKLRLEKEKTQEDDLKKKAQEAEVRALLEEAAKARSQEEQKLQEEEAVLKAEAQKRLEDEAEKKRLGEEEARKKEEEMAANEARLKEEHERMAKLAQEEQALRLEQEKAKEEAEKKRIEEEATAKAEEEKKRLAEEASRKAQKEKLAEEAALKAEREKWTKLAEAEHSAQTKETEGVSSSAPRQDKKCQGAILLKAIDCLIGVGREINELIAKELNIATEECLGLTDALIFDSMSPKEPCDFSGPGSSHEKLDNFSARVKELARLKPEIIKIITAAFTEVRGVKIHFIDGSLIYLDGQLHSTWTTQYIPYDFSSAINEVKMDLNRYFFKEHPLVLFSAPGYDVAPKDFFNLLLNIGSIDKYPDSLTLFGNKQEDLEKISLANGSYSLLFGLWPWQYTSTRKVKKIGEFDLKHLEGIDKDLYLAEIEIDLLRASLNQTVTLKGVAIKTTPSEKIRLVVLSNAQKQIPIEKMAQIYLGRWPNLEEAFHDFSRKIELFSYVSNAQKFFSNESFNVDLEAPNLELKEIFENYMKMLDTYLRWHFLPSGYVEKNFKFSSENFYNLPAEIIKGMDKVIVKLLPPPAYQLSKDLEYLSRRFNERQIILQNGSRLYFESVFK